MTQNTDTATQTERIISDMLKEDTGRHMLDSGGIYGRHFERNQAYQFATEPERALSFCDGWIDLTLNLYHYLVERLIYTESMQDDFIAWDKQVDPDRDISWFEQIPAYLEHLQESPAREVLGGVYADESASSLITVNTYNHESLLSQVIQFTLVHIDDIAYYILQIHNGADVRGGYTRPVFFEGFDDVALFDDAQAIISCKDNHEHNWFTDDGYHYYEDGSTAGRQLEAYKFVSLESVDMIGYGSTHAYLHAFKVRELGKNPVLFYDPESGAGYCPLCGGELE